jgi:hypothetical protein
MLLILCQIIFLASAALMVAIYAALHAVSLPQNIDAVIAVGTAYAFMLVASNWLAGTQSAVRQFEK